MAIKRAQISISDEVSAVAGLIKELHQDDLAGVIFFCSPRYDLKRLADELDQGFSCPVIGCSTAGEIADSYSESSIVGVSFSADAFRIKTEVVKGLNQFSYHDAERLAEELALNEVCDEFQNRVLFLLIDGLSLAEEKIAASLGAVSNVPWIGGSAGDELNFKQTYVYCDGVFHQDAAVVCLIETNMDIEICKLQHIKPTNKEVVVTSADSKARIVHELDGEVAATVYAQQLGLDVKDLSPAVFSQNPVMIDIGGEWYVRSIQTSNADGSLTFYCAIENGLPLTISRSGDIVHSLAEKLDELEARFSSIELTLGCDCILRRLEIFNTNKADAMAPLLRRLKFLGFNTYGEQYCSLHVNQTLTSIVFGEKE